MTVKQGQSLRLQLRSLVRASPLTALKTIGDLRLSLPVSAYHRLGKELRACAPNHRDLLSQVCRDPMDLASRGPIPSVSLLNEIAWGIPVIQAGIRQINDFLSLRDSAQESFAHEQWDRVLATCEEVILKTGWSFWAIELKTAALHASCGAAEAKSFLSELRSKSSGLPLALYSTILMDRVDDAHSFGSFRAKLDRSKDAFHPAWFRALICYRATGEISEPQEQFPILLSTDFASSIVDYYETLIDCLITIVQNKQLAGFASAAASVVDELIKMRVGDYRLEVISRYSRGADVSLIVQGGGPYPADMSNSFYRHTVARDSVEVESNAGSLYEFSGHAEVRANSIYEAVTSAAATGLAGDEFDGLLKIGLNFKALPVGTAFVFRTMINFNIEDGDPLLPLSAILGIDSPGIERMLCYSDEIIVRWIESTNGSEGYTPEEYNLIKSAASLLHADGEHELTPSLLVLWLARYLAVNRRRDSALYVCSCMEGFGLNWRLLSAKVRMRVYVDNAELTEAVDLAASMLIQDYRFAYELPLAGIFSSSSWRDFVGVNRYSLGIASHYANVSKPSGSARFICRMCCRELYKVSDRDRLSNSWAVANIEIQRLAVAFYEDVWTEENLALVDDLKSTHDVRGDRISVYQSLLLWNPAQEDFYSACILQLTLDETLWQGLKYIDENRLFVNDSAITRWAEKELLAPFERCRKLLMDGGGVALNEDLIRRYLINPSVENLVNALPATAANEANAALLDLVHRLHERFITDPADGLESYLSLRIRHGTLRGTILGPLEQAGLLITGTFSESAFESRWRGSSEVLDPSAEVINELRAFSREIGDTVKRLIDERVQVHSKAKPSGVFKVHLDATAVRALVASFKSELSFPEFIYTCYQVFWMALQVPRAEIAEYISSGTKGELQRSFDAVITRLDGARMPALVTALRLAATQTQQQCDVASRWFTNQSDHVDQHYPLDVAIEIAGKATKNIYHGFPAKLELMQPKEDGMSLTSRGLAVLYDCLFVAFENAWKHSGLGEKLGVIAISLDFDRDASVLNVSIGSALSESRAEELTPSVVAELRASFMGPVPGDAVAKEGGSGFAKLAKAVRMAKSAGYPCPLDVQVKDRIWTVIFSIPLYQRGGAYDAFV